MLPAEAVDKSKLSGAARVGFPVRIGGSVDHPEAGSLEMWTQHELEGLFCAGVQTIPQHRARISASVSRLAGTPHIQGR